MFLNLTVEDDTGSIIVTIDRHHYLTWGLPIVEQAKIGDWYLWKGTVKQGFRRMYLERWRRLSEGKDAAKTGFAQSG
jgi:hypothetical protein